MADAARDVLTGALPQMHDPVSVRTDAVRELRKLLPKVAAQLKNIGPFDPSVEAGIDAALLKIEGADRLLTAKGNTAVTGADPELIAGARQALRDLRGDLADVGLLLRELAVADGNRPGLGGETQNVAVAVAGRPATEAAPAPDPAAEPAAPRGPPAGIGGPGGAPRGRPAGARRPGGRSTAAKATPAKHRWGR
jgi:hypothetical protein